MENNMDFEKYIFVDFENVQDISNFDMLNENVNMIILLGENQTKIPANLVQKAQSCGKSIQWKPVNGKGKNALDFFIAYFLGYYIAKYKNKEYIIYSKDTGYDPLIRALQEEGHNVIRISSFDEIDNNKPKNDKAIPNYNEDISKIKKNLSHIALNKRPKTRKSLTGHITALLNKPNKEIEKIIEEMVNKKIIICEENKLIKYNLE